MIRFRMFREKLRSALQLDELKTKLEKQSSASYLRALRVEAGKTLEKTIGNAVPLKGERSWNLLSKAKQGNRLFFVVERDSDNALFLLLVDN